MFRLRRISGLAACVVAFLAAPAVADNHTLAPASTGLFVQSDAENSRKKITRIHQETLRLRTRGLAACIVDFFGPTAPPSDPALDPLSRFRGLSLAELTKELAKAVADHRVLVKGLLQIEMAQAEGRQKKWSVAETVRNKADGKLYELRAEIPKELVSKTADDAAACAEWAIKGEVVGKLHAAYIEASSANEIYGGRARSVRLNFERVDAIGPPADPTERKWDGTKTSWNAYYIGRLADRIVKRRPDEQVLKKYPEEVREFLLSWDRHFAIQELEYMAQFAVMFDSRTGWPIEEPQRSDIARLILLNMAEYFQSQSKAHVEYRKEVPANWLLDPALFFKSDDWRAEFATRFRTQAESDRFRVAALLSGTVEPTPKQFFLATAHSLTLHSSEFIDAFIRDYLQNSGNSTANALWETGLGTRLRVLDVSLSGNDGIGKVKARLKKVMKESDRVAAVFKRAAEEENPAKLSTADHKLLEAYGFIVRTTDADTGEPKEIYTLANSRRSLGHWGARLRKDLDLPGATVLDVVSPRNVAMIAAAALIPQATTAWLSAGLEGLVWSERGMIVARALVEGGVSFYWDSALEGTENYFKKGEFNVNWERNFLDSVLLGGIQSISGDLLQLHLKTKAHQLRHSTTNPQLKKFLKAALNEGDPTVAREIFGIIEDGLLVTNDTALGFAFQGLIHNEELDSADFLTMLLQGAMARAYGRSKKSIPEFIAKYKAKNKRFKALHKALQTNPGLRKEFIKNLEASKLRDDETAKRYIAAVRQEGGSAETRFHQNLAGEFSFKEMKTLLSRGEVTAELMAAVDVLRERLFDKLVHIARIDAVEEIKRSFNKFYDHALEVTKGDTKLAKKLALQRQKYEIDAAMEKPFTPGSRTPTSDIDRATRSIFLRKHLVHLWDLHARANGDGDIVTSAKAFDVNEYINVFPFIKNNREFLPLLRKRTFDAGFGAGEMSHDQAKLAIALSGAMRSMSIRKMDIHIANHSKRIINLIQRGLAKDADLTAFKIRAKWAKAHLLDSRSQLAEKAAEIVRDGDGKPGDGDVELRAKEKLYNDRMTKVADLQWELSLLEEQNLAKSPNALDKRARIERELSIAMRDGIETYTSTVGLDIIVNRVQADTKTIVNANGETEEVDLKIADRLEQANFTLEGELGEYYSKADIQGLIHDQVMFLAQHAAEFNHGLENEYLTGRALGKYLERYFLGEKILGMDIAKVREKPESDPTRRLLEIAQALVRHKNDPAKLVEVLQDASRQVPPTARNGVAELFYLMEAVVPGMREQTDVLIIDKKKTTPPPLLGAIDKLSDPIVKELIAKIFEREKSKHKIIAEVAGSKGLMAYMDDELSVIASELAFLRAEKKKMLDLARKYRLTDWKRVIKLQKDIAWHNTLMVHMPSQQGSSATWSKYNNEKLELSQKLAAVENQAGGTDTALDRILTDDDKAPEYRRIKNRISWLEQKRVRLIKQRKEAEKQVAREAQLEALNLSGDWICGPTGQPIGEMHITHANDNIKMAMVRPNQPGKGPHIEMEGRYVRGRLRGLWWDPSDVHESLYKKPPMVRTSMVFEATTDEKGSNIQFTKNAPEHPAVNITWSSLICIRKGTGAGVSSANYIQVAETGVEDPRNAPGPQFGKVTVTRITPDGRKRTGAAHLRRGRVSIGGPWFQPGSYRLYIGSGPGRKKLAVRVSPGRHTKVTVRPGGIILKETSPLGEVRSYVEIYRAEDTGHAIMSRFIGKAGVPLAPGRYKLQFGSTGTISRDNIVVSPGRMTTVTVAWAGLKIRSRSGKPFKISRIVRDAVAGSGAVTSMIQSADMYKPESEKQLRLPPGDFVIQVEIEGKKLEKNVSLKGGAITRLEF